MSADELSERVGVSRSTIFRYEKGDIEKVGPEVLKKIADTLNIYFRRKKNINIYLEIKKSYFFIRW